MLCATVLVILLNFNISEARSDLFWLPFLNILPENIQWKAKVGIGAVWAYANSQRGHEVESVMETVFDILPDAAHKVTMAPTSELYLPKGIGYLCWSEGTAYGVNTIQRVGPVITQETDGITTAEVNFRFLNLKMDYNKCGYKKGLVVKAVKCKVNVGNHLFKVKFAVRNVDNYKTMLKGVFQNHCVLTMIDFKLAELEDFGLEVSKRDGAKGSFTDSVLENVINANTIYIRYMITRRARVYLYTSLKLAGSFICKDPRLDEDVKLYYPNYLRYISEPGADSLSPRFYKLCGTEQQQAAAVETQAHTYYVEEEGKDSSDGHH